MGRFAKLETSQPVPETPGPESDSGAPEPDEFGEEHYLQVARGAFADGDYETALRRYSRALQLNINLLEAWLGQVRALIELGELEEAQLWADKALERFRDAPDLLAAKASAHARHGRAQTSMEFSDASLTAGTPAPYVWLVRGECLLAQDNRSARFCFMKALEGAPCDWQSRAYIGMAYLRYGYALDASRYLTEAASIQPDNRLVWLRLAETREALGRFADAVEACTRSLQVSPGYRPAKEALARLQRVGLVRRLGAWLTGIVFVPRRFEVSRTPAIREARSGQ